MMLKPPVTIPDWLREKMDLVIESDDWPNGIYPEMGFAVMSAIGDATLDIDGHVSLLQMLIDELTALREQSAREHKVWEAFDAGAVVSVHRNEPKDKP